MHKEGDLGRLTPTRRVQFAVPGDDSGRKGGNPKRGIEHNPVVSLRREKLISWVQNHYTGERRQERGNRREETGERRQKRGNRREETGEGS